MSSNNIAKGIIVGVVVTAIGALWVQPWAERRAETEEALQATISAGPWSPYPMSEGRDVGRAWGREGYSTALIDTIERGEVWGIAQVRVQNPGSQVVTNIRLDMRANPPDMVLVQTAGAPLQRLDRPDEVVLPDLAPGQSASFIIWASENLATRYRYTEWKSYSSIGPIRFNYPDEADNNVIVQRWIPFALGGVAIFFFVAFVIWGMTHERYLQRLLANEDFYRGERARYSADPTVFRPTFQ